MKYNTKITVCYSMGGDIIEEGHIRQYVGADTGSRCTALAVCCIQAG